jgi:hypothetical protein
MPSRDAHLQFAKWAKEYGPIYSLMLGTQCLIILSSDEAVKELLDRRSGIYSHRQEMYTGQQLCSGGLRMLMMVLSQLVTLQLGPANKVISGLWTNLANHAQNGSRAP